MLKYHPRRPALHHRHADGAKLARLSLLVNIGDAAFWTILPIQLSVLAGGDGPVGFYFAAVALLGTVAAVASSATFRRHRKIVIGTASLALIVMLLVGMSFAENLWVLAIFDLPRSVAYLLLTIVLGLLVRDLATAANIAIKEGRRYLFINLGWLIGPLVAGYVARFISLEAVFLVISGLFAIALVYLWGLHFDGHPAFTADGEVERGHEAIAGLIEYLKRPRLRRVFLLAVGLEVWWVVSSIYIPLAVIDLGYGPDIVGWVVTGGVVPLVLLEVWVGRQAQARGTRNYMVAGFLVLGVGAASFPLLGFSPGLLLFMFAAVNVGAALIEPLTEAYFFEVATLEEAARFFGIYNASAPMAGLLGPLVGAVVLTAGLGLDGVWVAAAVLMLGCARIATRIKDPAQEVA
jgi:MFS family permease